MLYVIILQKEVFKMGKPSKGVIAHHTQGVMGKVQCGEICLLQSIEGHVADGVQLVAAQEQILNACI